MEPRDHRDQGRPAVTHRRLLRISVKLALLAAMAAFAGVFVYGMFSPGATPDNVTVGDIPEASARLVSWNGRPVWVVHRSPAQLETLAAAGPFVAEPQAGDTPEAVAGPHRSRVREYGIYLAETARSGVLVQYTDERPDSLSPDTPWRGGFVDPASKAVFDLAGRRYRTTTGGPLTVPPHRLPASGELRLGQW